MYNFGVYHVCGYYTMNCSAMTWYIYELLRNDMVHLCALRRVSCLSTLYMNCSTMTWYIYAHSGAYHVCRYYTINLAVFKPFAVSDFAEKLSFLSNYLSKKWSCTLNH